MEKIKCPECSHNMKKVKVEIEDAETKVVVLATFVEASLLQ